MKKLNFKVISLLLALSLLLTVSITSCTDSDGTQASADTTSSVTEFPTHAPSTNAPVTPDASTTDGDTVQGDFSEIDGNLGIKVMVLNGTTGFGIAKLMDNVENGFSFLNCDFIVESDASNITAALLNGTADIAALPTNAAANLFNKNGSVQMLAINTLGVLYVVTAEGVAVDSFEDLEGKTVYCPAQNPTFIFKYLCEKNGLIDGQNITIDNTYTKPDELRTALVTGRVDIAVIPEPMVTIATSANSSLNVALDLTAEWDKVAPKGSLAQGCLVVRKAFAEEHPSEVRAFLEEYEASVSFTVANPEKVGEMIQNQGVFSNGAVAANAIPNCNICFISGDQMKPLLDEFFAALYSVAPQSIGNAVPNETFYYISK